METTRPYIEIPLSKKKLTFGVIGALIFVIVGVLFLLNPDKYVSPIMRSREVVFISGIASVLFFGACFVFIAMKLGDSSPGLIISDEDIIDNSSWISPGQILWTDIEEISVSIFRRQKIIMLHVKNPQDYMDRQTSGFKRKMMTLNYKMYGTPLSITSNALKINFDELLLILRSKLKN